MLERLKALFASKPKKLPCGVAWMAEVVIDPADGQVKLKRM
jgi:hypothetical protein